MKQKILLCAITLLSLMFFSCQKDDDKNQAVEISQADFQAFFSAGKGLDFYVEDSLSVNIGFPGADQMYDFSGISLPSAGVMNIDNTSLVTWLANRYPGMFYLSMYPSYPIFQYAGNQWVNTGDCQIDQFTNYERYVYYTPGQVMVRFPIVYQDQWNQSVSTLDSTYEVGVDTTRSTGTRNLFHVVDGWGTLKIPGYEGSCLRIWSNVTNDGESEVFFFTREGPFLRVGMDGSQPSSGTVQAREVMFGFPAPQDLTKR